ncbi:MAG: hypothetical protein CL607_05210 [Anaerolineaceae bacterium]|nr:hypothetical protein [Anaerolineaceae bacterium]
MPSATLATPVSATAARDQLVRYWLPPLLTGIIAFFILVAVGDTPVIRSGGMALAIVGVALGLRRMGAMLCSIAGLILLMIPAFWAQSGGQFGDFATVVIALIVAFVAMVVLSLALRRPTFGLGIGIVIFAGLFWSQIGTPQSLRLGGFVVGWLMFLIIDMLLMTNPHPSDSAPLIMRLQGIETGKAREDGSYAAQPYHTLGILLLYAVGILNDGSLVFLAPTVILSLALTKNRLPRWYWLAMTILVLIGLRGFAVDYLQLRDYQFLIEKWRDADRWFDVSQIIVRQFSPVGIALSILGLSRLARWYPVLGIVTMFGYGAYFMFGLVYVGPYRAILMMPLFIIQITWMTYAIFAIGEWSKKSLPQLSPYVSWVVYGLYGLIPLQMLLNITNVVN